MTANLKDLKVATLCPQIDSGKICGGVMTRDSQEVTTMGRFSGIDLNRYGEVWTCLKCKRHAGRTFKWEAIK
jgi:hypothetical protein